MKGNIKIYSKGEGQRYFSVGNWLVFIGECFWKSWFTVVGFREEYSWGFRRDRRDDNVLIKMCLQYLIVFEQ